MYLVVFAVALTLLCNSRSWFSRIEPRGAGATWIGAGTFNDRVTTDRASAPFCAGDASFDYAYSATEYVYTNIVCGRSVFSEVFTKLAANILFVPTFYEEVWKDVIVVPANGGSCTSVCESQSA